MKFFACRKPMRRAVLIAATLLPLILHAQPDTLWTRSYPNASNALSIENTPDGGFIVSEWIGFPYDAALLKLDSFGNVEWERTYGTPGTFEEFIDAKPCPSGGYVAVGARSGHPTYQDAEVYIVRTNDAGDTLWTRTANIQDTDGLSAVEIADNGDLICVGEAGYIGAVSDSGDVLIMRYSDSGDLIWQVRYRRELYSTGHDIARCGRDTYIIAGQTGREWEDEWSRAYVLMIDGTGDTLWTRTYGIGFYEHCKARVVTATRDGGFALTGSTTNEPVDGSDMIVMRGDSLGNLLWSHRYPFGGFGEGIAETFPNELVVFFSSRRLPGVAFENGIARLIPSGDTLWTALYGTPRDDYLVTGLLASDRSYVMLGFNTSMYLIRTEPDPMDAPLPPAIQPQSPLLVSACPNPFNAATAISYTLTYPALIQAGLYDLLGRRVQTFVSGRQSPGRHHLNLNGEGLPSGIYFVQINTGKEVQTIKLLLAK